MSNGSRPEGPADHRGALKDRLLARRQMVDPRGDQCLQRVGDAVECRAVLRFGQRANRFLEEQRISLGLLEQRSP
jgi:hypothetical protein